MGTNENSFKMKVELLEQIRMLVTFLNGTCHLLNLISSSLELYHSLLWRKEMYKDGRPTILQRFLKNIWKFVSMVCGGDQPNMLRHHYIKHLTFQTVLYCRQTRMDITRGSLDGITRSGKSHQRQRPGSRVSLQSGSGSPALRLESEIRGSLEILPPETNFDYQVLFLFIYILFAFFKRIHY